MRTREEQIIELRQDLRSGKTDIVEWGDMSKQCIATAHILEAEHRAEQRVRAEIARDSERLDWLLSRTHYGIPGFDPVVSGRTPLERKADLIRAIDAAREAE